MKMANKKPKSKINLPLPDSDAPQVTQVASEDTGDAPQPDDATSSIDHDTPAETVDAVKVMIQHRVMIWTMQLPKTPMIKPMMQRPTIR
jgi:hypothetical protein